MPKVYMLIGVPGSGKSTWIKSKEWPSNTVVVSSDRFIDDHAAKEGKTYNDVFKDYAPIAMRLMDNQVLIAKTNECDIIWDQTNMSTKSRAKKLAMLDGYEKIAVVFATPEKAELDRRLASRPGKFIGDHIIKSMIDSYNEPSVEEGFKEIWRV